LALEEHQVLLVLIPLSEQSLPLVVVLERATVQRVATGGAAADHTTIIPLGLVEMEHLAKVTTALPMVMMVMAPVLIAQAGGAAQVRLALMDQVVAVALAEWVYHITSVVRPYITQVVAGAGAMDWVDRILQGVVVEAVGAGVVLVEQPAPQELLARLTLAGGAGVGGAGMVELAAPAALAAPGSSLLVMCG
jgi:hypothetical protein